MVLAVRILAVLVMAAGLIIIITPTLLNRLLASMKNKIFLYFAIFGRLILGALLIWTTWQYQWPIVVLVIGLLIFLSGVVGLFLGQERLFRMIDWFARQSPATSRLWGLLALFLGTLLFIAVG